MHNKSQKDISFEASVLDADDDFKLQPLPDGVQGDVNVTDLDCSVGWTIWYPTALDALRNRLRIEELSALNIRASGHLLKNILFLPELDQVKEIVEIYNL